MRCRACAICSRLLSRIYSGATCFVSWTCDSIVAIAPSTSIDWVSM